jgi:PKD repeat protein
VLAAPPARAGVHPAEAMWQDMGLTVQAGDVLRVTAAGTWRNGSQALTAAGDGSQVVTGSNCPVSGAPLLALVARIGATGTPFLVRGGEPITATTTGTVYLAPNDNWYTLWDNGGSLAVAICVSVPEPVACTGVTATVPATGGAGSPVTFTAQPSPSGCTGEVAYEWDLGDGLAGTQQTVSHTYYSADSYTWTLSAMIDGVEVAPQTGTIVVSTEACTPRTVVAAPPARPGVDPVEAMWQDMGLTVQAGHALRITAAGTWRNGSQALTAAGHEGQAVTGSNCPASGAPLLALVARIGATGTPFLVRGGEAMPVTATGKLYLAPNDNWYTLWDNSGSLAVTICSRQ